MTIPTTLRITFTALAEPDEQDAMALRSPSSPLIVSPPTTPSDAETDKPKTQNRQETSLLSWPSQSRALILVWLKWLDTAVAVEVAVAAMVVVVTVAGEADLQLPTLLLSGAADGKDQSHGSVLTDVKSPNGRLCNNTRVRLDTT
jgi:hypothetical protein